MSYFLRYGRSLASLLGMVLVITFISFLIMRFAPGDPTQLYLDPTMGAEDILQIRRNLGLDDPLLIHYAKWMGRAMTGDLGVSYITGKPVLTSILERLPATMLLSVSALLLIVGIACPVGLYIGYKAHSVTDKVVTIVSFIAMAMPAFWVGLMLILVFSLQLNLFPTSGFLTPTLYHAPMWVKMVDIGHHLVLPLVTTVIGGLSGLIRYNRFNVLGVLTQDYITAARARGIGESRLLFKHAFKNASLPLVTILGLSLPDLIGGSLIIEYVFSWPGMGQLGVTAVFQRDYPILMGVILFSSILILLGNRLADMTYRLVDPRIQRDTRSGGAK